MERLAWRAAWGCEARCGAAQRRRGGSAVWSWRWRLGYPILHSGLHYHTHQSLGSLGFPQVLTGQNRCWRMTLLVHLLLSFSVGDAPYHFYLKCCKGCENFWLGLSSFLGLSGSRSHPYGLVTFYVLEAACAARRLSEGCLYQAPSNSVDILASASKSCP